MRRSFFIWCKLQTKLLHTGVITPFTRLRHYAPIPLPLCGHCGALLLTTYYCVPMLPQLLHLAHP